MQPHLDNPKLRKQESKVSSVSHTLASFKDVLFIIIIIINLEGKPSISPVLIFILSMPGNEREKPGDCQKRKTNHSRKLEYFLPFALSVP